MSRKSKLNQIVALCKDALQKGFDRGDYRELIILTLVYLRSPPHEFKRLQTPGADSKARWMSKILFSLKIVLLSKQLEIFSKGEVLHPGQLGKIEVFVDFVVYCYVPWWITCSHTSSAPINDITLLKSFMEYKSIHLGVATTATRAFESHLWYLTEELVPLSLFSDSIDEPCKEQLKDKMITCRGTASSDINSKRRGHAFGKPIFPLLLIRKSSKFLILLVLKVGGFLEY